MSAPGVPRPGLHDRIATLRSAPLLRSFSDVGIRILAQASVVRTVGRGTYAFRAGDPGDGLSVIARGVLQMRARDGSATLGELGVGESLGALSLLAGGEHLLSAWTPTEVELVLLSRESFETLRQEKPGASLKLLTTLATDLAERLREAKGPLREFLAWQVSKRQG